MKERDKLFGCNFSPWVNFAEEDLLCAKTLLKEKLYNQVCFHSQQAAEKMLKAFLKSKRMVPPKLHNLLELLEMCKEKDGDFKEIQESCEYLSRFYLSVRYPDALPGFLPEGLPVFKDAKKALEEAENILDFVKTILLRKEKKIE